MVQAATHISLGLPERAIIGMVHLQPLPGSPRFAGDLDAVEAAALADARALAAGGVHAIIVENFGDAPFHATTVEPVTIAASSDRMSPNMLPVTITSKRRGSFTRNIAPESTS